jgi:hypothetical protein
MGADIIQYYIKILKMMQKYICKLQEQRKIIRLSQTKII